MKHVFNREAESYKGSLTGKRLVVKDDCKGAGFEPVSGEKGAVFDENDVFTVLADDGGRAMDTYAVRLLKFEDSKGQTSVGSAMRFKLE